MQIEEAISLIRREVGEPCDVSVCYYDNQSKPQGIDVSVYVYLDKVAEPAFSVVWAKSVEQAYRAIIEQVKAAAEASAA